MPDNPRIPGQKRPPSLTGGDTCVKKIKMKKVKRKSVEQA